MLKLIHKPKAPIRYVIFTFFIILLFIGLFLLSYKDNDIIQLTIYISTIILVFIVTDIIYLVLFYKTNTVFISNNTIYHKKGKNNEAIIHFNEILLVENFSLKPIPLNCGVIIRKKDGTNHTIDQLHGLDKPQLIKLFKQLNKKGLDISDQNNWINIK